ncbi:MAG TPA: 2-oxoacid:ferredoxin oxidoreductase subunit gamma [Chloroflexi bacterium]|jgi:2-oxoglutarate ferredoxin oxidoreductase subunit gamma|nr:2-oxoacid:acceptor oxidoreductase family protein [Anaerolineaceae bacterium]HHX09015.1 2-oxoacid:ferredoxin oxidoreductase subunit gamma [Chloroflexota bacterium]
MQSEIIISGFGGQGTLYAGQVYAYAAMDEGKHVTWIPSYGPEMRGGTANCSVVISDEEIGSPTTLHPRAVIALNLPSLDKYEPLVAPGGYLIVNESMVNRTPTRTDIHVLMIPANDIARELGNERAANMVLLGALEGNMQVLPDGALEKALEAHTAERLKKFIGMNIEALHRGAEYKAD